MPTEPTHLSGEELQWLRACKDTPNRQVTWHDAVVVSLSERLDAARRELAEANRNADYWKYRAHGMSEAEARNEILGGMAAPPSEHSEGKQDP